jgi:2-dehydro-3-deoxygluconokinase
MSDEMCASWEEEGIDTSCVLRLAGRLPGIYLIETDARGERRFHYWRRDSAARHWLEAPDAGKVLLKLASARMVYLSGISLAILAPGDRELLIAALARCRAQGGSVVFDNNYRPRLWESAGGGRCVPPRACALRHRAPDAGRRARAVRPARRHGCGRAHARAGRA